MEIFNLLDTSVKQQIINRINQLTPQTKSKWGKMDVAQMLCHVQAPISVAFGNTTVKGNWLMKLILPFFKSMLYNEKPWKQGLPTDKTFITTDEPKDFEKEKNLLLDMLNRFTESNMINDKHPIFGRLTKEQWSKATWKHLDHHLQQFGV